MKHWPHNGATETFLIWPLRLKKRKGTATDLISRAERFFFLNLFSTCRQTLSPRSLQLLTASRSQKKKKKVFQVIE